MKRGLFFGYVLISVFMSSCATMVTTHSSGRYQMGPSNEKNGGIVSYCWRCFFSESRREAAYEKMHEFCGGSYVITQEEKASRGAYYGDKELFLHFECK